VSTRAQVRRRRARIRLAIAGLVVLLGVAGLVTLLRHGGQARAPRAPRAASAAPALPGALLIADRGNNRMLVVDARGRILWRFPTRRDLRLGRRLRYNDDAFVATGGRAIVANEEEAHTIVSVNVRTHARAHLFGTPGVRGAGAHLLNTPDDAYPLPDGSVIVADAYNCRVLRIRARVIVHQWGDGVCRHDPPRSFGAINGDTPLADGGMLVSEIPGHWIDDIGPGGRLRFAVQPSLRYPSDPQALTGGRILVADYANPGHILVIDRTGRTLWRYGPTSGPGRLDHPSLALPLPGGDIAVNDDYRDRVVIIDPAARRIVWQYGLTDHKGSGLGMLDTPDGLDFVPVDPAGRLHWSAVHHPGAPATLRGDTPGTRRPYAGSAPHGPVPTAAAALIVRAVPPLPTAAQDVAVAAASPAGALALGGLDPAQASLSAVRGVGGSSVHATLPTAVHDAAAVVLGGRVFLFGGGQQASYDTITAIDPRTGATNPAGTLPQPRSDLAAVAAAGTAYVIGGYTGQAAQDSILAWRPGASPRVVAHLPAPTRYAAATATDRGVVIAGGSIGPAASRAILRFDPATGRVMRIGTLPAPLTHAAAATLDGVAYVIGGRGAAPDTPSDAILAVDPATGAVRLAGRLPRPLSDAGAAAVAGHILVVGGRSAGTPIRDVYEVTPTARAGG
jgi:hypothetical protein